MLGMRRRQFITLAGGAVMAWPLTARAQQRGKVPRLGVLLFSNPQTDPQMEVLHSGLRDLGYDEVKVLLFSTVTPRANPNAWPTWPLLSARKARFGARVRRRRGSLRGQSDVDNTDRVRQQRRSRPTWAHREPCSACRQRHRRHAPSGRYCFETFGVPQGGGAARTTPRVLMESGSSRR